MEIYHLENILHQTPEVVSLEQGVVMTDTIGTIIYWNPGAEALYGWRADEAEGRKILDVVPTRISQERAEKMMGDLRRGREWSGTFFVHRRGGTIFLTHAVGLPLCDARGSLIGIVTISGHILDALGVGRARRVFRAGRRGSGEIASRRLITDGVTSRLNSDQSRRPPLSADFGA